MKKLLIITYYWPPHGGAGVQRWLKFVKYLRDFGWEPVVYTAEEGEAPAIDHSLEKDIPKGVEVIRRKIWEPYSIYKKFIGQKKEQKINAGFLSESKKPKFTEKLSVWVRGNLFIPDARKFWIKPSIKYLTNYLKNNPVDAIVSTGPPHSMHLIAMGIKKNLDIPWVADFRDPWTNIDFYDQLMLSGWADRKHRKLETKVLQTADRVIAIGQTMAQELEELGARKVTVITNGYDHEDLISEGVNLDQKFSIAHIGSINKARNSEALWNAISELVSENEEFAKKLEIKLVGKVDINVLELIKNNRLDNFVKKIAYMQHDQVIKIQQSSQLLLLLLNRTRNAKGILTGKIFEYLAAKRPVLCIGLADSDAAEIIQKTNAGLTFDFDDKEGIKNALLNYFQSYRNKRLRVESDGIEQYSRRNLTKELTLVLNDLT